jgi:cell division protein FtsB
VHSPNSRRGVVASAPPPVEPVRDDTLFADFTRPIEAERQLVTSKGPRRLAALLAVVVIAALAASMFVLPVQAWLRQRDTAAAKQAELKVLDDANATLSDEIAHLQTTEGAKEAAREELGVTGEGDQRIGMLAPAMADLQLPSGWPYDAISQIIAVRAAGPIEPTVASTVAPSP